MRTLGFPSTDHRPSHEERAGLLFDRESAKPGLFHPSRRSPVAEEKDTNVIALRAAGDDSLSWHNVTRTHFLAAGRV